MFTVGSMVAIHLSVYQAEVVAIPRSDILVPRNFNLPPMTSGTGILSRMNSIKLLSRVRSNSVRSESDSLTLRDICRRSKI